MKGVSQKYFVSLKRKIWLNSIALGSYLVIQFCRWRCRLVFPGRSKNKHVLSCLLSSGPGKTETDRPLANQIVPIKAAIEKIRPSVIYLHINLTQDSLVNVFLGNSFKIVLKPV